MTPWGTSVLYAPDHVYGEVYEHLPDLGVSTGIPVARLRAVFEDHYLPILRFVTVADEEVTDPQVLAIADPDDVPTGQLAKLISPCLVFSDDKHLRKPGFAVANWPTVAGHAADLADGVGKHNVAGGMVVGPGYAVTGLIRFLGRQLGVSPWLVAGIAVLGVGLLVTTRDRRTRFVSVLERYGVPFVQSLAEMMSEAQALQSSGLDGLREVILPAPSEPSVKQQIAIILARQPEPLLAGEIQDRIQEHFPADVVPGVTEIRTVLGDNPEFEPYQRYRWELGRFLAPRSGRTSHL